MSSSAVCPKCRRVQYFVCGNKKCTCYKSIPKGKKPQRILKHDALACPYCGFTQHIDYWGERDMQAMYREQLEHCRDRETSGRTT